MKSIYDIAHAVGVSASTVSFVLNGKAAKMRIAQKTQDKVLLAAEQMGYIPNVTAKKLSDRNLVSSPEIALLWSPEQHSSFLNVFINHVQRMISAGEVRDMRFTIVPFPSGDLKSKALTLTAKHFNGMIISPINAKDIKYLETASIKVPVILLHGTSSWIPLISVDNYKIGQAVAELFFAHGHKKALAISNGAVEDRVTVAQRISGFVDSCRLHDLQVSFLPANFLHEHSPREILHNIDSITDFVAEAASQSTAIFLQNDLLSICVVAALKKLKIRVPEDIEVVTYGSDLGLELSDPSITAVEYPADIISIQAIKLMAQLLSAPHSETVNQLIVPPITFRQSCPE